MSIPARTGQVGCVSQHALGRGVCLPGGVSARGSSAQGVCIPACTEADTSPGGQTDRCKNITFATSLRTVINDK